MDPPQNLQGLVIVGLDANGNPVEAGLNQPPHSLFRDGVRIRLQGHLGGFGDVKGLGDGTKHRPEPLHAEIAGGAAAKIHGVHDIFGRSGAALLDVGGQRRHILIHQFRRHIALGQGVKITVLALAAAKGHMDINPQGA